MKIKTVHPLLLILFFISSCKSATVETKTGEQLAKTYCSACHLFPDPALLDSSTWKNNVLPAMADNLGIKYYMGQPYETLQLQTKNTSVSAQQSPFSLNDWNKLVNYYISTAPAAAPKQNRLAIQQYTNLFNVKRVLLPKKILPSTTYIKIDEGNHCIYAANDLDSSLNIYSDHLEKIATHKIHSILVDMQFYSSLQIAGDRSGVFTNIGILNPNDLKTGTADSFKLSHNGSEFHFAELFNQLPRPVQITKADLNKDSKPDYLICGFGNKTGDLYWMKNNGNNNFQEEVIRPLPGAIKTYIEDFNHDGLPDIIALMAQAQEGIFLFANKGDGTFDTKEVLSFPPVYGSSYFELDDFNNDGYKDILYTCGDNADYSSNELKNFHGVYIFLNDGKNNFTQKYFFPIHGCYKAIAKDFDKDGDLDIAAISYFPDFKNQPQESFVYLENKGNFNFSPSTIKEFNEGRWLTMDAGDVDGDGDDDIVIGSFIRSNQLQSSQNVRPAFLLLENKTK